MAGTLKVNQVQLGDNSTAANNFVWQTNADGTAKLARGNVGATTQDILTVDASGRIDIPSNMLVQANQPILPSSGTTITFNHGLGYIPVSAELEFVCLTAEAGYVANDVVNPANGSASYAIPPSIKRTTTLVSTTTGVGAWVVSHASTGGFVNLTAANWAWRFKVRAK